MSIKIIYKSAQIKKNASDRIKDTSQKAFDRTKTVFTHNSTNLKDNELRHLGKKSFDISMKTLSKKAKTFLVRYKTISLTDYYKVEFLNCHLLYRQNKNPKIRHCKIFITISADCKQFNVNVYVSKSIWKRKYFLVLFPSNPDLILKTTTIYLSLSKTPQKFLEETKFLLL